MAEQQDESVQHNEALGAAASETDILDSTPVPSPRRKPVSISAWIPALVVGIVLICLLNAPYQYESIGGSSIAALRELDVESARWNLPPRMAGWPTRYLIDDSVTGIRHYAFSALATNIIVLFIPVVLLTFYVRRRSNRVSESKKMKLTISDLLVLTLIIAAPLGWYQRQVQKQSAWNEQNSKYLARTQIPQTAAWVPSILKTHLPKSVTRVLRRPRGIRLEDPREDQVAHVVSFDALASLRLGGGDYDLRLLDSLTHKPHLRDLRIAGRQLDERTVQLIGSLTSLESLNLMRTNVSGEAIGKLELPNLRSLNLMTTDVKLSELGNPVWSKSIESLILPHSNSSQEESATIEGWPNLKELTIKEIEGPVNNQVMRLRLSNLPELKTLKLDQFQKFDLDLRNLPKLENIVGQYDNWELRIPRGGSVPGAIWLDKFQCENLPSLKELSIYASDLTSFRARGIPLVETLGVAAYSWSNEQRAGYVKQLKPENASALIRGLGESEGPPKIDFDSVPLKDADLSPLENNDQIKAIYLADSGSSMDQWRSLKKMTWLEEIRVPGNAMKSGDMQRLLDMFPNLKSLELGDSEDQGSMIASGRAFVLADHDHLETLKLSPWTLAFTRKVQILNMPRLKLPLSLQVAGEVEIKNTPHLKGLSIGTGAPARLAIDTLKNAEFFAMGGPSVTDQTVSIIKDAESLNLLTLAYTSLTPEALGKLPLGAIQKLYLPGNQVTDEIVAEWPALNRLTHLDLSDTQITEKSLVALLASPSLQYLKLDRCNINPGSMDAFAKSNSLMSLSLSGIQINANALDNFLDAHQLRMLDVSGTSVAKSTLAKIAETQSTLDFLSLDNCKFDERAFIDLVRQNRKLVFDLSITSLDTRTLTALGGRVMTHNELLERRRMEEMFAQARAGGTNTTIIQGFGNQTFESMIDLDSFARALGPNVDRGTNGVDSGDGTESDGGSGWNLFPGWNIFSGSSSADAVKTAPGEIDATGPESDAGAENESNGGDQ